MDCDMRRQKTEDRSQKTEGGLREWKAGTASAVITPGESMWMAEYAARREPSRGKETELFVKALALEDGQGGRAVIVTADLIAVSREIADFVCAEVYARCGISRENLVLSTSHTHCGPEVRPSKVPFFHIPEEYAKKIPGYVEKLEEKWVDVICAAVENLQPAVLSVHQTSIGFAQNRREAAEFFDHDVPVVCVRREDASVVATVFGYACHNTTLRPEFVKFCGDYAGYAQQYLQERLGGQAMFIAGAGADQNPQPLGSLDVAKKHGADLAEAVLKSLERGTEVAGRIRSGFEEVMLDFQEVPSRAVLKAQTQSEDLPVGTKARFLLEEMQKREIEKEYACPVQLIQLGEQLTLIAIGGEPVSDFAMMMKKEFAEAGKIVWVAGYCNDMFGYVPTVRVQRQNSYEGGRAMLWSALPMPFTETVEERVMSAVRRMVETINADR
jgi:neutral ceramidase